MYSYGSTWMWKQVSKIQDLWNDTNHRWRTDEELGATLGRSFTPTRKEEILQAIPNTWSMKQSPLLTFEWVLEYPTQQEKVLYQMQGPHEGKRFYHCYSNLYKDAIDEDPQTLTGKELRRARVITTGGDLRTMQVNPNNSYTGYIWLA